MDDGGPVNGAAELKEILQGDVTWHGKNQDKCAAYGLREKWNNRSKQAEREGGREREMYREGGVGRNLGGGRGGGRRS